MSFQECVNRGKTLLTAINAAAEVVEQSQWTSFKDLERHGWLTEDDNLHLSYEMEHDINAVLQDSSLDLKHLLFGNNVTVRWRHGNVTASPDSIIYYDTGGWYEQVYNIKAGTIFVTSIWSPLEQGPKAELPVTGNPYPFPPLRFWSDVTYLQWAELANDAAQRKGLERVVHCNVTNNTTRAVIDKVFATHNTSLAELPDTGLTLHPEDGDDFTALLGTPNASGTARLLAQHKAPGQLGLKVVESIGLFVSDQIRCRMVINIADK